MDHYAVLGVHRRSTQEQIREAYLKLVRKYHPDVNPGHPAGKERLLQIQQAFDVLGDPARRAEYDRSTSPTPTQEDSSRKAYGAAEYFGGLHRRNPCPSSDPDIPRIMLTATIAWAVIMVPMLLMVFLVYTDVQGQISGEDLDHFLTSHGTDVETARNICFGLVCVPTAMYGVVICFLICGLLTQADTPRPTRQKKTAVSVERKAEAEQQSRRTRRELLLWLLLVTLVYTILVCMKLWF